MNHSNFESKFFNDWNRRNNLLKIQLFLIKWLYLKIFTYFQNIFKIEISRVVENDFLDKISLDLLKFNYF